MQAATIEEVKTLRLQVDPAKFDSTQAVRALDRAAEILRGGGLVALPTETVYGLGANALDQAAVEKIFSAKQRPAWDPIIVHIAGESMLDILVDEIPDVAHKLIQKFWPGPLTLLLPRSPSVPDVVTAGRPLVGVRMPAHAVALELIRRAGVPVAAPSANVFGHISPTTAAHVIDDLDGRIDAVLDAGPTAPGVESTVADPCQSPIMIYRPGAITLTQIEAVAGPAQIFHSNAELVETPREALPSPGAGLRHYAPRAKLILIDAHLSDIRRTLVETASREPMQSLGIMLPDEIELPNELANAKVFRWGRWSAPHELARRLYAGLRELDAQGCTAILCPVPPEEGIGVAIRDRLRKAGDRK